MTMVPAVVASWLILAAFAANTTEVLPEGAVGDEAGSSLLRGAGQNHTAAANPIVSTGPPAAVNWSLPAQNPDPVMLAASAIPVPQKADEERGPENNSEQSKTREQLSNKASQHNGTDAELSAGPDGCDRQHNCWDDCQGYCCRDHNCHRCDQKDCWADCQDDCCRDHKCHDCDKKDCFADCQDDCCRDHECHRCDQKNCWGGDCHHDCCRNHECHRCDRNSCWTNCEDACCPPSHLCHLYGR
mmetsp:Transcript_41850/g.67709  ORF Transcript_41850/g.67709 Transcript_41850/m.67709 type:complete len:243 (+) Transcript_41850:70-798(+)